MKGKLGLVKLYLFNLIILVTAQLSSTVNECPDICNCIPKNGNYKVKCQDNSFKFTSLEDFNLEKIPTNTVHLDLSDNAIGHLHRAAFSRLKQLEKLDLKNNTIKIIDSYAFYNLSSLKRLDISRNKISEINGSMFDGIPALERLKLSENNITHLNEGAFQELPKLKYLDVTGNSFACDCHILWFIEWMGNASHVKFITPLKCKSPEPLKEKQIKKLGPQELGCLQPEKNEKNDEIEKIAKIVLHPSADQVVFEGDSLMLLCQVWLRDKPKVWWTWDRSADLSSLFHHDVTIETRAIPEKGQVDSSLNIASLLKDHAGRWECKAESELRNLSSSLSILVISNNTRYCPETVTSTNKGIYLWPQTIVGTLVELPCASESSVMEVGSASKAKLPLIPTAHHFCAEEGIWEGLNTTSCVFLSETTKALEQFAKMNLSLTKTEVLESAQRLLNFTADGKNNLQDTMDIVFISKTVENYLSFVDKEKALGPVLVDLVGVTSKLPPALLASAQLEDGACNRLIGAVEYVASSYSHPLSKPEMAVEEFQVRKESFLGITCTWYSKTGTSGKMGRLFYCSTSNKSSIIGAPDKIIEASIQVPASLFHQLEMHDYQLPPPPHQLMVSAFENSRLFPRILPDSLKHGDGKEVASCVVGSKLVGVNVRNLTDPVYVMIRAPVEMVADEDPHMEDAHEHSVKRRRMWLVRWDQDINNGLGGWSDDGCHLSHLHLVDNLLVFHCDSLGHFGLLRDIPLQPGKSRRWTGAAFQFSHPAVYVGSFIGFFSMLVTVSTYVIFHASIHMSRKAKHSLINTWIAMSLLLMMFSLGIRQTGHFRLCQGIGLLLHYLILSSLLWMVVTLSNMYKKLTKSENFNGAHDDEPPPDHPPKKPMLGFYLVGWGIALIICGISGAVNMKSYAGRQYCFLAPNPSISAIYVPAAGILFLILVFALLIRCVSTANLSDCNGRFSVGTRATENVDLELEEANRTGENASVIPSVDHPSNGTTLRRIDEENEENDEDLEHSPYTQLGSHMALLFLFLLMWTSAALTTMPFQSPAILQAHGEAIFGVLYGVFSSALGIFVLVFYCVLRCDVRSCWEACWNGGEILVGTGNRTRGSRCCRSRSISDVGAVKPVGNIDCTGKQNGVVSLSQCPKSVGGASGPLVSNYQPQVGVARTHQNSGTDDSTKSLHLQVTLPGPQLPPPPIPFPPQGVAALDSSTSGPDVSMFYNPHQMGVARKFFRRQRQLRHGRRGVSGSDTASPPSVARRRRIGTSGNSDAERGVKAINKHSSPVNEKDANKSPRTSPAMPSMICNEKASTPKLGEDAEMDVPVERFVIGAEDDGNVPIQNSNKNVSNDEKTECEVNTMEVRVCGNGEESCSSPICPTSLAGREIPGAVAVDNPDSNSGNLIKYEGSQCNSLCNFDVGDAPAECTSSDSGCKTENRDEEVKHSSDSPATERNHLPFYNCNLGDRKDEDRLCAMRIRGSSDSEVEVPCVRSGGSNRVFDVSGDFTSLGRTRKKHYVTDCHHGRCRPDFMYITPEYVDDAPRVNNINEKSELLPESKLSEGNSELDSYNSDEEVLLEDNSNVMKKETSV